MDELTNLTQVTPVHEASGEDAVQPTSIHVTVF